LEVHAPHQPIHSWRDFFIHLITITIGLLIALGLEGLVEMSHHRNLVKEARADLRAEMTSNHALVASNLAEIRADREVLKGDIRTLVSIRSGKKEKKESVSYRLKWSPFGNSAWKTTENSGALIYMDFESERDLADVYDQQDLVSSREKQIERDHALAMAAFLINEDPEKMTSQETQLGLQRSADLVMDLQTLEQWLLQLDEKYVRELNKF
jgi:hypothetical protein